MYPSSCFAFGSLCCFSDEEPIFPASLWCGCQVTPGQRPFQRRRRDQRWRHCAVAPDRPAFGSDQGAGQSPALIRQRIYGLAQGYEDLKDHDTLRHDLAWQTAVDRDQPLASSPTLCRLENRADRAVAWAVQGVLFAQFIASFTQPPAELILDFDATDDRGHDQQEGRFFDGYCGDYCFLPLYVFCGEQLLVSYFGRPTAMRPVTRGRC